MQAVLVSNGPGELYTWVQPVLGELRRRAPELRTAISLLPCQFASGNEGAIARSFGADAVTTPSDFLKASGRGSVPGVLEGDPGGFVLSLGGNTRMALLLGERLGYPTYRYAFVPYWHPKLKRLFVHDAWAERKARLLGAPGTRLERVGNLVADAVSLTKPVSHKGEPHILLIPGSRNAFAQHLIPLIIAVADRLGADLPNARFVWPVSRLLSEETVRKGVAGVYRETLGGVAGRLTDGFVLTPNGIRLELVSERERYAHMRAADLAVTIPGTNTLELGIAGVPSLVMLPLNRPELIPLEGPGHWLSLVPVFGTALKRQAVRVAAPRLPVALPNVLSGESLMLELKGSIHPERVVEAARSLLDAPEDLSRRRARLLETMPKPGAAERLVTRILGDVQ